MANTDSKKALLKQLKDPFPYELVKWRQGGKGKQLPYIDARDVMKRLDDVMGIDGWQSKMISVDGGFVCELSLNMSVDEDKPNWITKTDGSQKTNIEPIKGGISGALKRAAHQFGVGRALYYMDERLSRMKEEEWPVYLLPNSDENWEDIAQLEADMKTGMDEDESVGVETLDNGFIIRNAKNIEELRKFVAELPDNDRVVLANVINNKTEELLNGADDTAKA